MMVLGSLDSCGVNGRSRKYMYHGTYTRKPHDSEMEILHSTSTASSQFLYRLRMLNIESLGAFMSHITQSFRSKGTL